METVVNAAQNESALVPTPFETMAVKLGESSRRLHIEPQFRNGYFALNYIKGLSDESESKLHRLRPVDRLLRQRSQTDLLLG